MSLEAIAAMLGHRSMDMTLRYAKIADRTVADEYFAVTDKVDALYGAEVLPTPHVEHSRFGLESPLKTSPEAANVALPDIGESFDSSQTMLDLIAVAYSLGLAASVLWLGALGDRYGRKLMIVLTLGPAWGTRPRSPRQVGTQHPQESERQKVSK
jgi:hypothetical protein